MQITMSMNLPRDSATLPLVRHLCRQALSEIHVVDECTSDIELAITEACANVIRHVAGDDAYLVEIEITPDACELRVIDAGRGFDFESLGSDGAAETAEGGRGVQLMRALVDAIDFRSEPESGTVVHLVKNLEFDGEGRPTYLRIP